MKDIDQISDKLLREIMQMELEINKILALNNNKENRIVKQFRQFILAKKNKLNRINNNYKELADEKWTEAEK